MTFQIFLVPLLLLNTLSTFDAAAIESESDLDANWENFKQTYQKVYEASEEEIKKKNFEENFKEISEHNQIYEQGLQSFKLGLNSFADLIIEDFIRRMTGFTPRDSDAPIKYIAPKDAIVPDSVDWRKQSAVTPVKDQGSCGACFAFSATGALEGQYKQKYGKLVSLSEQNIIDCSRRQGNEGCDGGFMNSAFQYVMINRGLDSEISYPYKEKEGLCSYKEKDSLTSALGYSDIIPRDENTLKTALALVGPISVGIDANNIKFQLYKGGIYDNPRCSSTNLNHGVLAVGYGTENGRDYWIVKNSWGPSWGEDGYIRMSRNKNNQCGIAAMASFPVI